MDKDKMIEDIVNEIENCCEGKKDCLAGVTCNICAAKNLVNAGYGHIPTAIKEFAEKLKVEIYNFEMNAIMARLEEKAKANIIDELVKEYEARYVDM